MLNARLGLAFVLSLANVAAAQEVIIQPEVADTPQEDPTRPLAMEFPPLLVLVEASGENADANFADVIFKVPIVRNVGPDADGRPAWSTLHTRIDGKIARAYDADGHPIEPKHLPMRLSKLTRAVLFHGKIDPYYLGLYRKDFVLFVIPAEVIFAP